MLLSAAAAGLVLASLRPGGRDDWAAADRTTPPPLPAVPADARPVLVASGPLAGPHPPAKPVVAADGTGTVVVIAQDLVGRSGSRLVQWRSGDGGASWEPVRELPGWPEGAGFYGDPWLETDRRGRFYYVHLAVGRAPLVFRRSADGGKTWSPPVEVAKGVDRPVLGVSPDGTRLVLAASMGEKTAAYPKKPLDSRDPQLAAKLAAAYRFFSGVFVSADRGRNWERLPGPLGDTHAIPFAAVADDAGRVAVSLVAEGGGSRSVVCTTADRGRTWSEFELVARLQPDRSHPFNGERFPVLAAGRDGRLHVAYVGAGGKGLFVRTSRNWNAWTDPVRLTEGDVAEVRMPAVAARGPLVHVTWLERRRGRWQAYYRSSRDGGRSWSDKVLLSVPHAGAQLVGEDGFDRVSDDDQSGVTDDGSGAAHAVWVVRGRRPGAGAVWHAVVRWQTGDAGAGRR